MIATSLPLKGAPRAQPGPYAVTAEPAYGAPGIRVFRRTSLERFPRQDTLPGVLWSSPGYAGVLTALPSGFLVITTTTAAQGSRPRGSPQATAADLRAAIDWADRKSARSGFNFMRARSRAACDAIERLPAFHGSRHGAGHTATVLHPGGGEFAHVASAWALWRLQGEGKARALFVGAQCGLCTHPSWDAASKRLGG